VTYRLSLDLERAGPDGAACGLGQEPPSVERPYNHAAVSLTPGTRLGVYEVTAAIGQGGMGQVFRACDTKLNRDVALKILPDSFAGDADRRQRFEREARTLAALNHPGIAQIYGTVETAGHESLVVELVPGHTLDEVIRHSAVRSGRGPGDTRRGQDCRADCRGPGSCARGRYRASRSQAGERQGPR
jgi:serine/threonine protein kinase